MRNHTLAKFTLTALAAFAISACGSSGGGDDNGSAPANDQAQNQPSTAVEQPAQPSTPTEQPAQPSTSVEQPAQPSTSAEQPTQPSQPSSPTEAQQPAVKNNPTDGSLSGTGFIIPKTGNIKTGVAHGNSATNINFIELEGKTVAIIPTKPGVTVNALIIDDDGSEGGLGGDGVHRVVGGKQGNIRYGFLSHPNFDNGYLIANGKYATEVMPRGTAEYQGGAVHLYSEKNNNIINTYVTGSSQFNVDFDNKTLTGTIKPRDMDKVDLSATISGNTFEGSFDNTTTKGGFYGQDANELTGSYHNDAKQYIGVFGAQKQ